MRLNHQKTFPKKAIRISPRLLNLIKKNKNFLIVSHINPEGDAIGSSIALALGLKKLRKYAYILSKNPVPEILKFLPHSDLIKTRVPSINFNVLLLVDCNNIERTGFKNLKAKATAVIDHHLLPPLVATRLSSPKSHHSLPKTSGQRPIIWVDSNASATGELIYRLLNVLNVPIDKKIATNLYTAILVDTGGFRYSNTSIESLNIASKLIEAGANTWEITKEIYENIPLNCLKLLAMTLSGLEKKGKIAWIAVTQSMFKKTNTSAENTENFADHARKIKGVEVGVLFREERKNSYKVSLRSKGAVNVADIAKAFGGGGHASAAGCKLNGTLDYVKDKVLKAIRNTINKKSKCKTQK